MDRVDREGLGGDIYLRTSISILETAVKISKASRGILFLKEGEGYRVLAEYGYSDYQKNWEKILELVRRYISRLEPDFSVKFSSELGVYYQGFGFSQAPLFSNAFLGRERRRFPRRSLSERLYRLEGGIYLEREGEPFRRQSLEVVLLYLQAAIRQLSQAKIYEMVVFDAQTRFFSHSQSELLLQVELEEARRLEIPLGVLLVSLGGGGVEGQDFSVRLMALASILRRCTREEDIRIRYDRESFLLYLPSLGEEDLEGLGRRILESGREVLGKLVLGASIYPFHGQSYWDLLGRAKEALSLARCSGREMVIWNKEFKKMLVVGGDLSQDYRNVVMLLDTIIAVNSTLDYQQLLYIVLSNIIESTNADRGILVAYDSERERRIAQDRYGNAIEPRDYLTSVLEWVETHKLPCFTQDMEGEVRIREEMERLGIEMAMCVPLLPRGRLIGLIYVDSRDPSLEITENARVFFHAISREIGISLENAKLYEENLQAKREVERLNRKLQEELERRSEELEVVRQQLDRNKEELERRYNYPNIVGTSKALQDIFFILEKIRHSDATVLITGESGTGKELIARAIHHNSPRRGRRFESINCAALPETLLESELLGYLKGAFSGAERDKKGRFELAHGGTIFLDEIGDMSLEMQKKLLRVLQEREIHPLGSMETIKVDIRIIAATNRDLKELMRRGLFREDLYFRLNVVHIHLPPLRERKEDIVLLAQRFLEDFCSQSGRERLSLTPEAAKKLLSYHWPGNVRELKNVIERAALLASSSQITEDLVVLERDVELSEERLSLYGLLHLPLDRLREKLLELGRDWGRIREILYSFWQGLSLEGGVFDLPLREAKEAFIKMYLRRLLERYSSNMSYAAKKADLDRSHLYTMLKKYGFSDYMGRKK